MPNSDSCRNSSITSHFPARYYNAVPGNVIMPSPASKYPCCWSDRTAQRLSKCGLDVCDRNLTSSSNWFRRNKQSRHALRTLRFHVDMRVSSTIIINETSGPRSQLRLLSSIVVGAQSRGRGCPPYQLMRCECYEHRQCP